MAKITPPGDKGKAEENSARKLDQAARAAWLYHAKGQRQDEVARTLNVSRQNVQRLIALASTENLIRFQLVHHLASAIELEERLRSRFGLVYCEVVPSVADEEGNALSVATALAYYIENMLQGDTPVTIGMGGYRIMRQVAALVTPMQRPMHHFVALMGNMTRHGRASHYDVIMGLAERVGAECYPLPMPVVTGSVQEKNVLQQQMAFKTSASLVDSADLLVSGVGYMAPDAPLYRDGFIVQEELQQMLDDGAVGEILGHCFDASGRLLTGGHHERLTSFAPLSPPRRRTMIAQTGYRRFPAIKAAFGGKLANCLITDEATARALLDEQPAGEGLPPPFHFTATSD